MRFFLTICILAGSFVRVFAEDVDFAFQQENPVPDLVLTKDEFKSDRYVSVSISGLVARSAVIEIGNRKKVKNDSFLTTLKQSLSKNHYSIGTSLFYQRHFNPFDRFTFYSGLGFDAGVFFKREKPTVLRVTPTLSLGKIIASAEDRTQFLELRTMLGHYYDFISLKNAHGFARSKFNYQLLYGVTF